MSQRALSLVPCFFFLYINDISTDIDSEIRLFADGCVCYREIKDIKDTSKLQKDIDQLEYWSRKWGMRFPPVKCRMSSKKFKKRSARFVTGNYNFETGSITGILEHLKWESLKKRRRDSRLILLYKGLMGELS